MRAYFFTNFYLNTISQGIQPAHCLVDMLMFYHQTKPNSFETDALNEWATNHKTIICLNGGAHQDIEEIHQDLIRIGQTLLLPVGAFCEDQYSLAGIKTCCGIVVPEKIYSLAADRSYDLDVLAQVATDTQYLPAEIELASILRSCRLAQ